MKPNVFMTLADPAWGVGVSAHIIDRGYIVILEAHQDWSWIVHLDRDLLETDGSNQEMSSEGTNGEG
ncbi:hypothetical protein ACFXTH_025409 [Malus domestica]